MQALRSHGRRTPRADPLEEQERQREGLLQDQQAGDGAETEELDARQLRTVLPLLEIQAEGSGRLVAEHGRSGEWVVQQKGVR